MDDLYFSYQINVWSNNSVTLDWEHTLEDAERNFNMSIKRCDGSENRVVLTHGGYLSVGKSRYQAEEKLRQLKSKYPTYTNFRITGSGQWDDPYGVSMEKVLKTYDVRTKKIYSSI